MKLEDFELKRLNRLNRRNDPIMKELLANIPPMTDEEFDKSYSFYRYSKAYERIQNREGNAKRDAENMKLILNPLPVSAANIPPLENNSRKS